MRDTDSSDVDLALKGVPSLSMASEPTSLRTPPLEESAFRQFSMAMRWDVIRSGGFAAAVVLSLAALLQAALPGDSASEMYLLYGALLVVALLIVVASSYRRYRRALEHLTFLFLSGFSIGVLLVVVLAPPHERVRKIFALAETFCLSIFPLVFEFRMRTSLLTFALLIAVVATSSVEDSCVMAGRKCPSTAPPSASFASSHALWFAPDWAFAALLSFFAARASDHLMRLSKSSVRADVEGTTSLRS
jgi:hypothetical protein